MTRLTPAQILQEIRNGLNNPYLGEIESDGTLHVRFGDLDDLSRKIGKAKVTKLVQSARKADMTDKGFFFS